MQILTFVLRVGVGALLIVAGALKAGQFAFTASTIASFRILPEIVVAPLAVLLPFFEIGLGAYLVIGLFTRAAAWIAAAQFALYAAAIASVVIRGLPVACGCFGQADTAKAGWPDVARDVGLTVVAVVIALRAPGAFALDRRLKETP